MNNQFTEEEIKTAKQIRDTVIEDDVDTLKAIYMAGEICMWDELRKESKWISVKAELPKQGEVVLVSKLAGTEGDFRLRTLANCAADGRWWKGTTQLFDVTHWQPLPANP